MFSRALGRDEHCKQISLVCAHSDSATLGLPPLSMCAFPVFTAQTLGCSARNYLMQAVVCMHFPGLSRSGSGSLVLHKGTDLVGPAFAPVPGLRSSGDQFLGACSRPQLKAVTYPLPSPSGSVFWVYNGRALCLFWEADLWLRPSWWMLTVQNPRKSWLATKSACSLVYDASLGPRLPPCGSGCPCLPVPSGRWAGPQQASSAQSFVL